MPLYTQFSHTPSHPLTLSHPHTWFALHGKLKTSAWLEESNFPFCRLRGGGGGRCEGCACGVNKLEGAVLQSLHPCTVQRPCKGFLAHIGQLYHLKRTGERRRLIISLFPGLHCPVLIALQCVKLIWSEAKIIYNDDVKFMSQNFL